MDYFQFSKKRLLLVLLFLFAFVERMLFDFGPNMELITMTLVLSSLYIGKKESFWLIFAIIAISDRLIGNSNIFLFTWSGFLIPVIVAGNLVSRKASKFRGPTSRLLFGTGMGVGTSLFFFLWTNFGVWALDSWGMYPDNLSGLIQSYINALPFFRANLVSTIIFVPMGIVATEVYFKFAEKFSKQISASKSINRVSVN